MPAAVPKSAFGWALKIGNAASSETFTTIGKVLEIAVAGRSLSLIEFTTHDVSYVQKIASFINNGQVTFSAAYDSDDTQHALLETRFDAKTLSNFQLVLTDTGARQFAFNGYITNLAYPGPTSDINKVNVTIDVCQTWTAT